MGAQVKHRMSQDSREHSKREKLLGRNCAAWQYFAAMNGENSPQSELNPADVAACAHMIWEKEGKPHGRDVEHWFQAETLLRAMRAADAEAAKEPAKAAAPADKPAPAARKRKAKRAAEQQGECATQ